MVKRFVITGAMGSGKSTVLNLLGSQGLIVVPEPVRQILAEQRHIGDEGVLDKNPKYFTQLLLSRSIYQYTQHNDLDTTIIYDRGIPDIIGYAQLFNFTYEPAKRASQLYRYETNVFVFPVWEDIYTTDDERIMSFDAAKNFGINVQVIYKQYGYTLINVPCVSSDERAEFIIKRIAMK